VASEAEVDSILVISLEIYLMEEVLVRGQQQLDLLTTLEEEILGLEVVKEISEVILAGEAEILAGGVIL